MLAIKDCETVQDLLATQLGKTKETVTESQLTKEFTDLENTKHFETTRLKSGAEVLRHKLSALTSVSQTLNKFNKVSRTSRAIETLRM